MCGLGPGRRQPIASVGLTSRTALTELDVQWQSLVSLKEQDTGVNGGLCQSSSLDQGFIFREDSYGMASDAARTLQGILFGNLLCL